MPVYHITPGNGNVNHVPDVQSSAMRKSQKEKHPDFLKIRAPLLSELFSCVILQYCLLKSNSTFQMDKHARSGESARLGKVLEEWDEMR